MDTNLYWTVRGTYEERKARLAGFPREYLEAAILDGEYNDFLSSRANYDKDGADPHGHGKRLPYIGWFWRHVEFHDLSSIRIGNCGDFIGFIPNNKWDYPERSLTEEEGRAVVAIIDAAMELSQQGGNVSEIEKATNAKLEELWNYMQGLSV